MLGYFAYLTLVFFIYMFKNYISYFRSTVEATEMDKADVAFP